MAVFSAALPWLGMVASKGALFVFATMIVKILSSLRLPSDPVILNS